MPTLICVEVAALDNKLLGATIEEYSNSGERCIGLRSMFRVILYHISPLKLPFNILTLLR
jgi:hypothetical protein